MKKTILVTLLQMIITCCSAQFNVVPIENWREIFTENPHLKDVNGVLNKYVGEWQYSDNANFFKIKFYKIENVSEPYINGQHVFDELRSFIIFKEFHNNAWITIYDTYPVNINQVDINNQNFNNRHIIHGNLVGITNDDIALYYDEPSSSCIRSKSAIVDIKYHLNNSGAPLLRWLFSWDNLEPTSIICPDGMLPDDSLFKIPKNMTLNKI